MDELKETQDLARRLTLALSAMPMDSWTRFFSPLGQIVLDTIGQAQELLGISDAELEQFEQGINDDIRKFFLDKE